MTVLSAEQARQFAEEWVAAWNAHDLERVLAHYDEQIIFSSPLIAVVAGVPEGKVIGKAPLRAYWSKALSMLPGLRFELIDVLVGANSLTIYYRGHRGLVAETFRFNSTQLVAEATACYSVQG